MDAPADKPKRPLGRPRRIDRRKIVEAALGMPPEQVTMQSVADRLGVDRSALHYHVKGRDELLSLTAAAAINAAVAAPDVPDGADWRTLLTAFAETMRRAGLAEAAYTPYLKIHLWTPPNELLFVDRVLATLGEAGLDDRQAAQVLILVSRVVIAATRDEVLGSGPDRHPSLVEFGQQVEAAHVAVPALEAFLVIAEDLTADEQFAFTLRFVLDGVDAALRRPHA